jgi:pyruvate dehydrogenase E1 component
VVGDLLDRATPRGTRRRRVEPAAPRMPPPDPLRHPTPAGTARPAVAVSDWMRAVPDQIAPFVPGPWTSLGTDGFGRSDTRPTLRRHFGIDAPSIVLRALEQLVDHGERDGSVLNQAIATYRLDDLAAAAGRVDGSPG